MTVSDFNQEWHEVFANDTATIDPQTSLVDLESIQNHLDDVGSSLVEITFLVQQMLDGTTISASRLP